MTLKHQRQSMTSHLAYSKELEEKLARQCKLNAQLDLENAKAVDADLSGPEEKEKLMTEWNLQQL